MNRKEFLKNLAKGAALVGGSILLVKSLPKVEAQEPPKSREHPEYWDLEENPPSPPPCSGNCGSCPRYDFVHNLCLDHNFLG